jgi:hypothetical protein
LQKQQIEKEQNMFTITADRLPAQGGIDPTLKLIDRNPEDKCDEGREALAVVNGNSSVSERSRWQVQKVLVFGLREQSGQADRASN